LESGDSKKAMNRKEFTKILVCDIFSFLKKVLVSLDSKITFQKYGHKKCSRKFSIHIENLTRKKNFDKLKKKC